MDELDGKRLAYMLGHLVGIRTVQERRGYAQSLLHTLEFLLAGTNELQKTMEAKDRIIASQERSMRSLTSIIENLEAVCRRNGIEIPAQCTSAGETKH
jgi:hypothetical protein